jgi:hypothetical protein
MIKLTNLTPVEWNEHNALAIHKNKKIIGHQK